MTAELVCLALTVYFEARSEPPAAQFAVAQVVLNRVEDRRWPDTICDVVWQDRQFSWTHDGKSDTPYEERAWRFAQTVAVSVVSGCRLVRFDGATHYHAEYVSPVWADSLTPLGREGRHEFYK